MINSGLVASGIVSRVFLVSDSYELNITALELVVPLEVDEVVEECA